MVIIYDSGTSGSGSSGSSGSNSGSSGSGYSYSVSGYCDAPYRDGKYVKVVAHGSGSSTYSGTLYINGSAVGSSWASANGGGTSGTRTLSWECPGPFESRTVTIRCKGQDRQGGGNFDTYAYPTTGSFNTPMVIEVTMDPNGGAVDTPTGYVYYGEAYGEMPVPVLRGKKFAGWYTEAEGGDLITEETLVTVTEAQTLYAHWENQAVVHRVEDGAVDTISELWLSGDGEIRQVIGIYLVENGDVKQAT